VPETAGHEQQDQPGRNRPLRAVIITASVGTGHNAAARALSAELQRRRPDLELITLDAMDLCPGVFRWYYAGGFTLAMTRFGWLYGLGFRLSDRPQKPCRCLRERPRLWTERLMLRPLAEKLEQIRPDLIVNTHFISAPVVRHLQQEGRIDCPQAHVVTDIQMHRWWYTPEMAHWFVPQPYTARRCSQWGVDDDRVTVSGIPIEPKWEAETAPMQALRDKWGLPAREPIALLSGGAVFTVGPIAKIARRLLDSCPRLHLIALAGRNKKLLATLSKLAARQPRLKPIGFTDCMHELVEMASLMITKPGGITTSECLSKGTPMLLMNPVPGQEGGNAKFFQRQGAAEIARGKRRIVQRAADILRDPDRIGRMSQAALALHRPGRTIIADRVEEMLDTIAAGSNED
jgi:processive 1,2-diacylglycerol beta-glucosyltransferase